MKTILARDLGAVLEAGDFDYVVAMEDTNGMLPHDPTGRFYRHYVYGSMGLLLYGGNRDECEAFVVRMRKADQN